MPQTSTGFSPFELLFGREVRGPLFLIKEKILEGSEEEEESVITDYVMEMRKRIVELMEEANKNERRSKVKEKVYYVKTTRKRLLKVGDEVLLLLPTATTNYSPNGKALSR